MIEVIGFEGVWPNDALVTWGAAAVRDDKIVWNAVSRYGVSLDDFPGELNEALVAFDPIQIRPEYRDSPILVVALRTTMDGAYFFKPDTGRLGGFLAKKQQKGCMYTVLKDRDSFDLYVNDTINGIILHVLRNATEPAKSLQLLTWALVIAPHSPQIHALRVILSSNDARVRMVAQASLRSPEAVKTYEWMLRACDPKSAKYRVKYKDGIASGGGMDADMAAKQFGAFASVHRKLKPVLMKRLGFLDPDTDIPAFRVKDLLAASADIGFVAQVDGEPLLHRIVRYYEMTLLQQTLQGHIPGELQGDQEFLSSVETLARPTEDTSVYHTLLEGEDSEPVVFNRYAHRDAKPQAPFTALGFVQGAARGVRVIELRLFPNVREVVSVESDGHDGIPLGADVFFERNDFLFRPAELKLQRFVDERGRYKFFLRSVRLLNTDGVESIIDAIPSSMVENAFLVGQRLTVSVNGRKVLANGRSIGVVGGTYSIGDAASWMSGFAELCQEHELVAADDHASMWLRAPKPRAASALARVVLTLEQSGGESLLTDLVEAVSKTFGISVRRNNTRRELRDNMDFVQYDPEDDEKVRLTKKGWQYAAVFRRAGGLVQGDGGV